MEENRETQELKRVHGHPCGQELRGPLQRLGDNVEHGYHETEICDRERDGPQDRDAKQQEHNAGYHADQRQPGERDDASGVPQQEQDSRREHDCETER